MAPPVSLRNVSFITKAIMEPIINTAPVAFGDMENFLNLYLTLGDCRA